MDLINKKQYGLDRSFALPALYESDLVGRVVSQEKGLCRVVWEGGELLAHVSGKLRHEAATALD